MRFIKLKNYGSLYLLVVFALLVFSRCKVTSIREYFVDAQSVAHMGRALFDARHGLVLISTASCGQLYFKGDSCKVGLKNLAPGDDYGYVMYEIDGRVQSRIKVSGDQEQWITVHAERKLDQHVLKIFKLTEAQNGNIAISHIIGEEILPAIDTFNKIKIEFIGNSITCGMGMDTTEIPCGQGKWYDQHEGYHSFAGRTGRGLKLQYMISAVSGIGIYRNWNTDGPTMPEVYESAYLNKDSLRRWDFSTYQPDLVSICLGTNDFSAGDGSTPRAQFDSVRFEQAYVNFVRNIYGHYPSTQVLLQTSPMLGAVQDDLLYRCLMRIATQLNADDSKRKPVEILRFDPMIPGGCDYHPSFEDHVRLSFQLQSFINKFVNSLRK
jgi:lysophospholipase L1-like esterase